MVIRNCLVALFAFAPCAVASAQDAIASDIATYRISNCSSEGMVASLSVDTEGTEKATISIGKSFSARTYRIDKLGPQHFAMQVEENYLDGSSVDYSFEVRYSEQQIWIDSMIAIDFEPSLKQITEQIWPLFIAISDVHKAKLTQSDFSAATGCDIG